MRGKEGRGSMMNSPTNPLDTRISQVPTRERERESWRKRLVE